MKGSYFLLFFVSLILFSCDPDALMDDLSEDVNVPSTLNIRLTDGPIDLDKVNIDLQQVFIKGPDGFEEIPLGTNTGIYDLLEFQDGKDVLIASIEDLELTQIKEIRLVLGENNTVVVDDETYDLKVPSGSQSGLKIKVCLDLTDMPEYDLILDFDAGKSVHKTGNGKYIMKPVIKVVNPDAKCGDEDEDDDDDDDDEDDKDDDLTTDDLPEDAIDWLSENYDGYKFEVERDTICDEVEIIPVFVVEAKKEEEKVYLYFDEVGTFLQSAEKSNNNELPDAVILSIEEDYPDYNLTGNAYQIIRENEEIWYQAQIQNGDEKQKVTYKEDGTFVCSQVITDEEDDDEEEEEEEDDISLDDLPDEIKTLLSGDYSGYDFSIEASTFCDGTDIYLLKGNEGSNTILLYFDLDWNLLQSAEQFDEDGLPTAVTGSIEMDYSDYKIMNNQAWEITRDNSDLWYRVYLKKNNSSEKFYVIYMEDGTFICQED